MKIKMMLAASAVAAMAGSVVAESTTTSAPAAEAKAVESAGRISAKDTEAAKGAVGKSATVHGAVGSVSESPSGSITFINFKGNERKDFTGIIKKEDLEAVNKGFDGDVAKALKGKEIELTGVVTDFKGTPQIEVKKPDQIKIVEKSEK